MLINSKKDFTKNLLCHIIFILFVLVILLALFQVKNINAQINGIDNIEEFIVDLKKYMLKYMRKIK